MRCNVTKPPFDKKEVRQAINMAIDKADILKEVYPGCRTAGEEPDPADHLVLYQGHQGLEYNPDKAKEMLKAAGVENLETDLWWMPVSRPYNPNAKRMAEMMQADLAKVGINAKLVSYEWGEYRKRLQAGRAPARPARLDRRQWRSGQFLLPSRLQRRRQAQRQNSSKWCNKDFNDGLFKARTLTDKDQRTAIYENMQKIFKEEAPWFTIAHSTVFEPVRKEVKGYKVSPLGRHGFYGVDVTEIARSRSHPSRRQRRDGWLEGPMTSHAGFHPEARGDHAAHLSRP